MRALVSAGVFREKRGTFRVTRLSRCLLAGTPGSMRPLVAMVSQRWYQQLWTGLSYSVKTGKPAAEWVLGAPLFQYFDLHPAAAEVFDCAMLGFSADASAGLLAVYDFSRFATVVDVGGGYGRFLSLLLGRYPSLSGVLFERPAVAAALAARTPPAWNDADVSAVGDRLEVVAGDFFSSVPQGGDAYVLMHVLHNWDDENAGAILRSCRSAMRPGATLLVVEMMIPRRAAPFFGTLFDLEMLVLFGGGRERTEEEFRALLEQNGFSVIRTIATGSFSSVLEARAAG
jgi:SAM-dependent methyltransferase